jgi:phosphoglycerate dehydrogenase-like enzyme
MKPGTLLANTPRGELIDEAAPGHAIESGRLHGVALDFFCKEPPGTEGWMALDTCRAVLRGERPAHVTNPEVYTGMDGL